MIPATFRAYPIAAVFSNPYRIRATFVAAQPVSSGAGVTGQLIDSETGALLFDSLTGAPLVW